MTQTTVIKQAAGLVAAVLLLAPWLGASADGEMTVNDGIYTAAQAESGKPLFEQRCSTCHNADFYKGVLQGWNGQPVQYLIETIMSSMPADNPGSLFDNEYEQIMAYIFSITGYPEGDSPLTYGSQALMNAKIAPATN
ncbi:MAG: cytochrome c [Pseudomonadales bacterium]|nr:cytochrome c [Pseudomonadales bacterium]